MASTRVVTRGANTYGPYHHPEKLIPLFITNALDDLPLPLYGDGLQRRDWLYVSDHAAAVDHVLRHGSRPARPTTWSAVRNGPTARSSAALLERLGKPWSLVREVEDRPGHDRRYAMDGARLTALGWRPATTFEDGLAATIDWYRANEAWWRAARSGDWDGWYERQYGHRLAGGHAAAAIAGRRQPARAPSPPGPGPDARRRDRGVRATRAGARGGPRRCTVQRAGRTVGLGSVGVRSRRPGAESGRCSIATGRRWSSMPRPGATWTAARSTRRLALRRNGEATGVLAAACAEREIDLVAISTNEVFDGRRRDGYGYEPSDPPAPGNPYGASKLDGERRAQAAYAGMTGASLGIVRTAWLFGTPGLDFPSRILDVADRAAAAGQPIRVVSDEWGTPTYTVDCAEAIVELLAADAIARDPPHRQRALRGARRLGALRRGSGRPGRRGRRHPDGELGAALHAAPLGRAGRRRRCPPANRFASGRTRWPTTRPTLLRATGAARASEARAGTAPA